MKQFNSKSGKLFRALILLTGIATQHVTSAQNSTTATSSNNCGIIRENFDLGNGGYTSPSAYGDVRDDSAFYYKSSQGFWTEMGEDGVIRPLPTVPRFVSILSTVYPSPSTAGLFDVGFVYVVPNANVDQFSVDLIRLTTDNEGVTYPEVVARSGFKSFAAFSRFGPENYNDPVSSFQNGQRGAVCIRLKDLDITTGSNINYRVSITYRIFSGNTYTIFDDFSLNNAAEIPLPVNFIGIIASKGANNSVNIRWDVADEVDVMHYEIERSTDGKQFTKIGTVPANKKTVYTFADGQPYNGNGYYRVRNVDIDGKSKYSYLVRINMGKVTQMRAFPTMANNQVTVEHPAIKTSTTISLATADGKMVKAIQVIQGTTMTKIDLLALPSGMYLLRFYDGTGYSETMKLVKQ